MALVRSTSWPLVAYASPAAPFWKKPTLTSGGLPARKRATMFGADSPPPNVSDVCAPGFSASKPLSMACRLP